jgi:hypothetical protein
MNFQQQLSLFPTEQEQKEQIQQAEDERSSALLNQFPYETLSRQLVDLCAFQSRKIF